ncbi:MAG: AarF/ABC1/UbiB kinase family protein [bacterium]|nr:AarF/ABC1/UbiB kinase family protein [bacterium]
MSGTGAEPSILGVAIRDLTRLQAVCVAVARHGFGEILMRTSLGPRVFDAAAPPEGDASLRGASAAVRFADLLGGLGPTFIKLGQILSMRRDLLPADWIEALKQLQDNAPVLGFEDVRGTIEAALGAPLARLFAEFDETPLATASIAQAHRARTHDGEAVVVKVQRPGIEDTMRGDLDLLYLSAQVLEASIDEMQLMGVSQIVEEFEKGLLRELDFGLELANMLAARQLLDPERHVTIPRPHPELSARTVLSMQFFEGRPLRELAPGSEPARHAVEEIVHAACKQVMMDGLFHGDPHGGNILINAEGTVCLIDFGLVGELSEAQRDELVTLVLATIAGDSATLARVLLRMGTPTQRVDLAALRGEIETIRERFLTASSLTDVDSAAFAEAFAEAAQRFRIKLAPEYSILSKALATVEGIVRHLHPEVDLAAISQPYLKEMMARRLSPGGLARELLGDASGAVSLVRELPGQLDQLLHDLSTGNLQIHAVTPELDEVPDLLHQLGGRLVLAAFAAALTLATAILVASEPSTLRTVLAWLSALSATGTWSILLGWHAVGRGKPLRLRPLLRLFRR